MALVPFDDRGGCIWRNGTFVARRDAKLPVPGHGLRHGVFARARQIKATQRSMPQPELANASEMFLAGMAAEVTQTLPRDHEALVRRAPQDAAVRSR